MRPHQYAKNLVVFGAWLFTASWRDAERTELALLAFGALSLLSSATYVVNDILDAESDRLHPRKKTRPIASGKVSPNAAWGLAWLCLASGLAMAFVGNLVAGIAAFLGIQIFYNLAGRKVPVLDVFVISAAFVLRAVLGAIAIQVTISPWILLCTGLLALLLGFAKRRNEFILAKDGPITRKSLTAYNEKVLDGFVWLSAGLATISYGLYAIESPTARAHPLLFATFPVTIYAILRYLLLVMRDNEGGEPDVLLFRDPHMVVSLVLFVVLAVLAMLNPGWPIWLAVTGV